MKVIILFFTMIQLFCADEDIIQFDHGLSPPSPPSSPLPYYYPSMPSPPEVMWTRQKGYDVEDILKIDKKLEKFYIKQDQKVSNKLAYLENKIDGIRSLLREIKSIASVDAFD